jgi:hypothetical protein
MGYLFDNDFKKKRKKILKVEKNYKYILLMI